MRDLLRHVVLIGALGVGMWSGYFLATTPRDVLEACEEICEVLDSQLLRVEGCTCVCKGPEGEHRQRYYNCP